jgi:hypothetical protein
MTYRASWRNTSGLGIVCIILAVAVIAAGVLTKNPVLVVIGIMPIAYLGAIGARLSASINEDGLHYRGWLRAEDVLWQDVVSIIRTDNLPYPRNRYYGPLCYEVRTANQRFVVNLLYFSHEFAKAFHEETKRRLTHSKRSSV